MSFDFPNWCLACGEKEITFWKLLYIHICRVWYQKKLHWKTLEKSSYIIIMFRSFRDTAGQKIKKKVQTKQLVKSSKLISRKKFFWPKSIFLQFQKWPAKIDFWTGKKFLKLPKMLQFHETKFLYIFHENSLSRKFKHFPSSKIDFWPFLKVQKMDFGQKNFLWNWFLFFIWFWWKTKKFYLIAWCFSVQYFKVSLESWKLYI